MKNKFLKLLKNKVFIIVFLVFAIFLPATLVKPAQGEVLAIVTAVGIDKSKDPAYKYSINLQILTPQSSPKNNENLNVVSTEGKTLVEGLGRLSYKLGKMIGFNHCNVVAIGTTLADEDVIKIIDYFYRSGNMSLHTALLSTDMDTKDLLEQSAELNNTSNSSIQNNSNFNNKFFNSSRMVTIGTFFNNYYQGESISMIQFIEKEDTTQGGGAGASIQEDEPGASSNKEGGSSGKESSSKGSSGGGSGGSGGSGDSGGGDGGSGGSGSSEAKSGGSGGSSTGGSKEGGESAGESGSGGQAEATGEEGAGSTEEQAQKKLINNEGKSAVYKKGKLVAIIDTEIAKGANWLDKESKLGIISLENVNGGLFLNAKIDIIVYDYKLLLKEKINEGRLNLDVTIKLQGQIYEINNEGDQKQFNDGSEDYFTPEVKAAVAENIKNQIANTLEFSKKNDTDLFYVYTRFYKFKNKEFKKFLKTLDAPEDYLQYVDINVNVEAKSYK